MLLEVGKVWQLYANDTYSGPFILKSLPAGLFNANDYWYKRVNLYDMNGSWSHIAHINTLTSYIPSNPKLKHNA